MPRTTDALVREIAEFSADLVLDPFILGANELVTEICEPPGVYSSGRLQIIETWLAAHLACINDPRVTGVTAGPVQEQYESKVDLGLKLTRYGQQAMRFDTGGYLAAMDNAMNTVKKPLPGAGGAGAINLIWLGSDDE